MNRSTSAKAQALCSGRAALIFVAAVWLADAAKSFFLAGTGDHDAFMMAAGVLNGFRTGEPINALNYATHAQFMFYYLFNIAGTFINLDGAGVLLLMNSAGTALALAAPVLLYFFIKKNFNFGTPELAPVLVIANSAYLFSLPYGHPFQLAFPLSISAFILLFEGLNRNGAAAVLLVIASALIQGFALTVRVDQVFLFWFCVAGLLIYNGEKSWRRWGIIAATLAAAALIFLISYKLLAAPESAGDGVHKGMFSISRVLGALTKFYTLPALKYSLPYHLTELGLPLLALTAYFLAKNIMQGKLRYVLGLIVSAGPTLLLFLGNPIPPRHFIITVVALSIFITVNITLNTRRLITLGFIVLLVNLALPPALALIEPGDERRNHSLNFVEKLQRNSEQVSAAFPFLKDVLDRAPENTVIFGKFVHLSQITFILSDNGGVNLSKVELAPSVRAVEISYGKKKIHFIECYGKDVKRLIGKVREAHPDFRIIPFYSDYSEYNELGISVPPQINYWSS